MTQLTWNLALDDCRDLPVQAHAAPRDACRHHYRIGPVSISIHAGAAGIADEYHDLYRACEVESPNSGGFRVDVLARRSRRTGRRHYHILANGRQEFTVRRRHQILPHIEAAVNLLVARHLPGYFQIHASACSLDGVGLICPGQKGVGKSTLAAALLARGWSYATDEFALIDPETRQLVPYPKALSIKSGSIESLRRLGLPVVHCRAYERADKGHVRCLSPDRVRPGSHAEPCRIGLIVFPEYGEGRPPALEPLSRAQAVFELARCSFSLLKFRARAMDLLVEVVKDARCYRLRTGDLTRSSQLIEAQLKGAAPRGQ